MYRKRLVSSNCRLCDRTRAGDDRSCEQMELIARASFDGRRNHHWHLGNMLYNVSPRDPLAFGLAFCVMMIRALIACFLPAWRAVRIADVLIIKRRQHQHTGATV